MAFGGYTGTTHSSINVNELIQKAKTEEVNLEDIRRLAKEGKLSSSDFARILIEGFEVLNGAYPNVGLPKKH
jgi:DNA-binding transcriptional regulator YiaG